MKRVTIAQMARLVQLAYTDVPDETREKAGVNQICFLDKGEITYGMYGAAFAFLSTYTASISKDWPDGFVAIDKVPNLQDIIEKQDQLKRTKEGLFTLPEPVEFMKFRESKNSKEKIKELLTKSVSCGTLPIPGDLMRPVTNIVTHNQTIFLIPGGGYANWVNVPSKMPNSFFGFTPGIKKLLETGCDGGIGFLEDGQPLVILEWKNGITGFVCPTLVQGVQDVYHFATKTKAYVITDINRVSYKELKEEKGQMAQQGEEGLDALKSLSVMNDFAEDDTDSLEEKKEELGKTIVTEKAAEPKPEEKNKDLEPPATWKVETTTVVEEPAPEEPQTEEVDPLQALIQLSGSLAVLYKEIASAARAALKQRKEYKATQKKLDGLTAAQARVKELEARNKELEAKFENLKKLFQ